MPQSLFFLLGGSAHGVFLPLFMLKNNKKQTKILTGIHYFHTFMAEINIE